MAENKCSGVDKQGIVDYETTKIAKTNNVCPMCEDYALKHSAKPIAVICCEGACLRGEVARQAANIVCHSLAPDKTVRVCLGGAFTKDTGQRNLVKNAAKVIALEGCFIKCASRMMAGVVNNFSPEEIIVDKLYDFDRNLFGVDEMKEVEIKAHADNVARKIAVRLNI
jgi:uncharacterized metal-binding protein